MDTFNIQEAKTHLSRLIDRVERGEEILLARNGKPVARLVKVERVKRIPGSLKDQIVISDNFDDPLPPEISDAFGGDAG